MGEKIPVLPFTRFSDMRKPKWSFLYAYNLRIVRDIFVYCALKGEIKERDLYKAMEEKRIPPPKDRWFYRRRKRKERLMLEYIHAAEYLGLIKKGNIKNEIFWFPDFSSFKEEKRRIIKENRGRCFESSIISPPFTENEKKAMLKIVLNYERARDFLLWFLDFNNKFPNIWSFDEMDFREYAEPIFIFGPIEKGKKGRHLLKREIDGKIWKIPNENPYDYTRLVSFVFPSWFKELGLIDEVIVFPEFSEDKKMWYMYYPIKMSDEEFLRLDMFEILEESFFKEDVKSVWIPYLIYVIARKYYCSTSAIKKSIINLYEKYPEHIHLGRAPLHLLKRRHKDSYIKIGGFFRSYLNMIKREEDEQ